MIFNNFAYFMLLLLFCRDAQAMQQKSQNISPQFVITNSRTQSIIADARAQAQPVREQLKQAELKKLHDKKRKQEEVQEREALDHFSRSYNMYEPFIDSRSEIIELIKQGYSLDQIKNQLTCKVGCIEQSRKDQFDTKFNIYNLETICRLLDMSLSRIVYFEGNPDPKKQHAYHRYLLFKVVERASKADKQDLLWLIAQSKIHGTVLGKIILYQKEDLRDYCPPNVLAMITFSISRLKLHQVLLILALESPAIYKGVSEQEQKQIIEAISRLPKKLAEFIMQRYNAMIEKVNAQ